MIRTQIYITKEEKKALKQIADERNTTQSNVIREAIDEYVAVIKKTKTGNKTIHDFAGIWKDKKDIPDIQKLRKGWSKRLDRNIADDN